MPDPSADVVLTTLREGENKHQVTTSAHLSTDNDEQTSNSIETQQPSESPEAFRGVQDSARPSRFAGGGDRGALLRSEILQLLGQRSEMHRERDIQEPDSRRAIGLVKHGRQVLEQAMIVQGVTLLDEAIDILRDAVNYLPEESPTMLTVLSLLGVAFKERFQHRGNMDDLEKAISLNARAIALTSNEHQDKAVQLNNLGINFQMRFSCLGEMSDLEEAIALLTRSVNLTPDGHPDKPSRLNNLGSTFAKRFERLGEMSDIEEAISLLTRSVDLVPDGHPNKPTLLNNLSNAFKERSKYLGDTGDLDTAISMSTRSINLTPDGHPNKPSSLSSLGNAFMMRFERLGEIGDLDTAVSLSAHSVDLTPDEHPDMPSFLGSLGNALVTRFERMNNIGDLEKAIMLNTRSVDLTPDEHVDKPRHLSNLASTLMKRFERLDASSDLDKAISLYTRSIALIPDGHAGMPSYLSNLASALMRRFERLGIISDLEKAVPLYARSIDLTPDGHMDKPSYLSNLANAFTVRFERLGEIGDLERAISLNARSIDLTPDGHPNKPSYLSNLGGTYMLHFRGLDEIRYLEKSISLRAHSVDLTPDGHPDKPRQLSNLGSTFEKRFNHVGEISDLDTAISLYTRSVDFTPNKHSDRPEYLSSLGNALEKRFDHLGEIDDLERAILAIRNSIELTDDRDPTLTRRRLTLAGALQRHFECTGHSASCPEAIELTEAGIASETSLPLHRLRAVESLAAVYWLYSDIPLYDKLVSTYEHAFMLIPEVVWLGSSIARRYELLKNVGNITSAAAAAAIAAGKLTQAVEWMEQGRGVVWDQLLQLRNPMDDLRNCHPDLAQQLQVISRKLERSANTAGEVVSEGSRGDDRGVTQQDETSARIRLAEEYKELLSRIRKLESFESFLLPKKYADFAHVCDNGPVVLINIHESSCDALVCLSSNRIIHVPLRTIDQKLSYALREQFVSPIQRSGSHRHEGTGTLGSAERTERGVISDENDTLTTVLCALWWQVVLPVLRAIEGELHNRAIDELPHVTWCATGPLASLPIHAAGDYGTPGGMKVFDYVVSSYAPTLSSLRLPSPQLKSQLSSAKILAISQPSTPGYPPLRGTTDEMIKLRSHFPGDEMIHRNDSEATVDAVLRTMDEHHYSYIHLACHGTQNAADPTRSAFVLHDGPLELARLMSKSADNAALAYLSACETAMGDTKLTEESVHLAAGMLAVGYRGVIGTLWSIYDEDAPKVADVFYRVLKERQSKAAEGSLNESQVHVAYALHEAMGVLRQSVGESNVLRWAPFVHLGL